MKPETCSVEGCKNKGILYFCTEHSNEEFEKGAKAERERIYGHLEFIGHIFVVPVLEELKKEAEK